MADAFSHFDTKLLLNAKHIMFLGDSNIRAQYKDMVWLLNSNTLVDASSLRRKLELRYLGDNLIDRSQLHHGRSFKEVRQYDDINNETRVEFMFTSRCYNLQLVDLFNSFRNGSRPVPDVIVMNSCLWDLTRWGPNGVPQYKDNMIKLMRLMSQSLPKKCLVIWTTALPAAPQVRGGLLIKQVVCMEPLLRFEVMEANTFARDVVFKHGFDVLDNHYHTRMQMHRRAKDGIHYMPIPVRLMTNLLLTHIALSWGRDLPQNVNTVLLDKAIALDCKRTSEPTVRIPTGGIFSKIRLASPVVSRARGLKITINADEERTARQCQLSHYGASAEPYRYRPRALELGFVGPTYYQVPTWSQSQQYEMLQQRYFSELDHRYPDPPRDRGGPQRRERNNSRRSPYRRRY